MIAMALSAIEPTVLITLGILCQAVSQVAYWRLYSRERDRALAEGRHTVRSWPGTEMRGRALRTPVIVGSAALGIVLLVAALVLMVIGG